MVLEMDPRSITSQPEDSLTIYTVAGSPKQRCNCAAGARNIRPQFQEVTILFITNINWFTKKELIPTR